jgi:group II intron reverse transcriptase/maturase
VTEETKQGVSGLRPKVWYSLYDRILHEKALKSAFRKVKSANGAPGIDGQSCKDFAVELDRHVLELLNELRQKTYQPQPVKRVEIGKPDGGIRLIGIPTVRDRVVQQALKNILEPIFDPGFHPSSYGYRPKMGAHDAIAKATAFMRDHGLNWVIDMDLSKCFDTLDHELIIQSVGKKVTDGSILNLIRKFLEGGVMKLGAFEPTSIGSPQGGVISPLLANIYLNEFDQFMKSRGHRMVRYADDILIFKASRSGADNARQVAEAYLEKDLKLTVNRRKTHMTTLEQGVRYLGVKIHPTYTCIQEKKVVRFKEKVKSATRRNTPVNLAKVIQDLNPIIRGFTNYFKVTNSKKLFTGLMAWIRRRLRSIQMKHWKKPGKLHRRLRQLGYQGDFPSIKMASWRNAASQHAHWAMPNRWFEEIGLFQMDKVVIGKLPPINRG